MGKPRKLLGMPTSPYAVSLMRLMETQSRETIAAWCAAYAQAHVLPIYENAYPGDKRPAAALAAARRWFSGEVAFRDVKHIILNDCHAAAREAEKSPAAQAAARACGQAAACYHTPAHALGFAGYAAAAILYQRLGVNRDAETYDQAAAGEFAKMEEAFRAMTAADESQPATIGRNS